MTGTGTAARRPAPVATRGIVEAEVRRRRGRAPDGGTLLLRAAPEWRSAFRFQVDGASVQVAPCESLLAVLDALSSKDADYLVILTPAEQEELGAGLLARVIGNKQISVNRLDLVRQVFGAKWLDPRFRSPEWAWLPEALLESQPEGGWPKVKGAFLDLDTALAAVTAARLGMCGAPDAASLLEWSQDLPSVARFIALPVQEQRGIADWLGRTSGPAADVLFRLVRAGNAVDALAIGLIIGLLPARNRRQTVIAARVRAERLFGGALPGEASLTAFAEASESLLLRWLQHARPRAEAVLERAQQLLDDLQAGELAKDSRILEMGYEARLAEFTETVARAVPDPLPVEVAEVDDALAKLCGHQLQDVRPETEAARMAARLVRRLAADADLPATVLQYVDRYVRDGAWMDRAVARIRDLDPDRYASLLDAVRTRRDALDEAFAVKLAAWSAGSNKGERLLLVEDLLDRVARPLTGREAAPLIIVVDGMSVAIAAELAERIVGRWTEIGRSAEGREGALAVLPSITRFSRASLLSGELTRGQQAEEERGFRGFWSGRTAELFHKSDIRDGVRAEVLAAVAKKRVVVGVVLNAIDDSLDKGRPDGRSGWRPTDIRGLPELLDAAWRAGRPVLVTSDHGHVLDRGDAVMTQRAEAARYRAGEPGDGEVRVSGRRVLTPDGTVTVPWNERIRYAQRKEGYHGGASLAEMVVPVLVLVPSARLVPDGWETYEPAVHEPTWWEPAARSGAAKPSEDSQAAARPRRPTRQARAGRQEGAALFEVAEVAAESASGLGERVVSSELFAGQRQFGRARVDDRQVAALIDALAQAGGKLAVTAAAQRVGQLPARMHGYVATVANILNIDGYQVLSVTDGGRTVALDLPLLREQFLGGGG